MAALHLIGGEKGGVGKSVLARILAQYCIDHALPFTGFDTDRSHATFRRFYGEYAAEALIDDPSSLDALGEAVVAEPGRRVLVDLAAQTMAPLSRWMEDVGLFEVLAEAQVPVTWWQVMDDGRDSLAMLDRLLRTHGGRVSYVIVLNHGRGSDFSAFHASPAKQLALENRGTVIELRKLHEPAMHQLDLSDASFWAAVNARGDGALGLFDRQRVKVWLNKTYADLAGLI